MAQFHKAERKKGKLRLAIAGPLGSGKTYSALLIAFGLGGRVAMIDTERGSGELYDHLGAYDVSTIEAPFEPRKYSAVIRAAEELGYDTIIIDSLTHAWAGQGGLLDIHGAIADRTGNSWSAWRQVTPRHNELVDTMLQSRCHVIATMRSKMEYTQVEENGKKQVKKLGMSPIQRDGLEYEFFNFSLPWDNYELYCHKRYSITFLAKLTEDQFQEQTKLLDSLKRPERLEAFREVLGVANREAQGEPAARAAAQ